MGTDLWQQTVPSRPVLGCFATYPYRLGNPQSSRVFWCVLSISMNANIFVPESLNCATDQIKHRRNLKCKSHLSLFFNLEGKLRHFKGDCCAKAVMLHVGGRALWEKESALQCKRLKFREQSCVCVICLDLSGLVEQSQVTGCERSKFLSGVLRMEAEAGSYRDSGFASIIVSLCLCSS